MHTLYRVVGGGDQSFCKSFLLALVHLVLAVVILAWPELQLAYEDVQDSGDPREEAF